MLARNALRGRTAAGLMAAAVLFAGCGEDPCQGKAEDAFQDYELVYSEASDGTAVEAVVREAPLGNAFTMEEDCKLEFDSDDFPNVDGARHYGDYAGFRGDGVISFTDEDGDTFDTSLPVAFDDFSFTPPATASLSGFEVTYQASDPSSSGATAVIETAALSADESASGGLPVAFTATELAGFQPGPATLTVVIETSGSTTGGSGSIEYRHVFAPVSIELVP